MYIISFSTKNSIYTILCFTVKQLQQLEKPLKIFHLNIKAQGTDTQVIYFHDTHLAKV